MPPEMQQAPLPPYIQQVVDRLMAPALDKSIAGEAAGLVLELARVVYPQDITVDLEANYAKRGGVMVRLAPSEAILLHMILRGGQERTPRGDLAKALHGGAASITPAMKSCIGVMVCGLRKKLKILHADVTAGGQRGYRVELQPITP